MKKIFVYHSISITYILIYLLIIILNHRHGEVTHEYVLYYYLSLLNLVFLSFISLLMAINGQNTRSEVKFWGILSIGFFYIALDEIFILHERIGLFFHDILNLSKSQTHFDFDSIIVLCYIIFGIVFIIKNLDLISKFNLLNVYLIFAIFFALLMVVLDIFFSKIYFEESAKILSLAALMSSFLNVYFKEKEVK